MLLRNLASATTSNLMRLVLTVGVLAFLASLVTTNTQVQAFSGTGSGTASDPYLISTCAQLQSIGDISSDIDALYWLANDIDCASIANFTPIPEFDGTLDGRNHTISNLTINLPSTNDVALIQDLNSDSLVTNLIFDDTNTITGSARTATLAGSASSASIRQVHSAATVTATGSPAGGIAGVVDGWQDDMVIEQSSYTGQLTSDDWAGGIVGRANNGYTIRDVLVDADISGYALGGVVGQSTDSCGYRYIQRAMVRGNITGNSYIGGFVGAYNNNSCYVQQIADSVSQATLTGLGVVGGAIGQIATSDISISNSYFEETTANTTDCVGLIVSGSATSCGDIGSNVAPSSEPYAQWDFTDLWQETSGVVSFRSPYALLSGPDTPTGIEAVEGAEVNIVEVTWDAPASFGSYDNDEYRVEIKKASEDWSNIVDYSTTANLSADFNNLRLGTEYDIRVQARTAYGPGGWVEMSYTTPDPVVYSADTCEELQAFSANGTALDTYLLTADIDCSGIENFVPQSWGTDFAGLFDGQGYTISNLTISGDSSYDYGLFGQTDGATIQDLSIDTGSVSISNSGGNCGAVVGQAYNTEFNNVTVNNFSVACEDSAGGIIGDYEFGDRSTETIEGISYSGSVEATSYNAGGLIGDLEVDDESSFVMSESYADATVTAGQANSGGLIGSVYAENDDDSLIPTTFLLNDSYAEGTVVSNGNNAGGIIGDTESYNDGYESEVEVEVENSYSAATVTAVNDSAGGIIGYMDDLNDTGEYLVLSNVFATGEVSAANLDFALIGSSDGISDGILTINNSYFDQTGTGQTAASDYDNEVSGWTAVNEDGNEEDYFKNNTANAPLDEWDFDTVWNTTTGYPVLRTFTSTFTNATLLFSPANHPITVEWTGCLDIDDTATMFEESLVAEDAGFDYPRGLVGFTLKNCEVGGTATITVNFFGDWDPENVYARKYNSETGAFTTITDAVKTRTYENYTDGVSITYQIEDGGELDQDGIADGNIVDPVGLAEQVVGAPNTGLQRLSR